MDKILTEQQGKTLLKIARMTIAGNLGLEVETIDSEESVPDVQCGTFVTLKKSGCLRGCIGNLQANESVTEGIRRNASGAAFQDSRFPPLSVEEFGELDIDISVLSQAQVLEYSDGSDLIGKLRPGIDGVILRQDGIGATFLPQVWDQLPEAEQFLGHLCRKAGLPETAWQDSHPQIEVYQVQCFKEEKV